MLSELVQRSVRAEFAKGLAKYRNLRAELEAVAQVSAGHGMAIAVVVLNSAGPAAASLLS